MYSPINSIIRAATRRADEPLNILTACTHESQESCLALTGHNFFAVQGGTIKTWNTAYRPVPPNYTILDGANQLPPGVVFDLVLSQNKASQFPILSKFAHQLHLPLINLEHCLPGPNSTPSYLQAIKRDYRGNVNVFITDYSRSQWLWEKDEAEVIYHGIDTDLFSPDEGLTKQSHALSVVNDWKSRDVWCGYHFWVEATKGLPVFPVGATPGLSQPAKDVNELVHFYRSALLFVNTSLISPVPTSLMEAMSVGLPVISTRTCAIPEIIQHGENGLLADNPKEMRAMILECMAKPLLRAKLGDNARHTIVEKYPLAKFVQSWDKLFRATADIVYT